jgi:hypothetical protein
MRTARVVSLILGLVLYGCGGPTRPGLPDPTLDNIWPNADSTGWTYQTTFRVWGFLWPDTMYASPEDVSPAPTLDEVAALLSAHSIGESPESWDGTLRLEFDGEATTPTGKTGQNLQETVFLAETRSLPRRLHPGEGFLTSLARARPDLRGRLATDLDRSGQLLETPAFSPLLIHGGVWEKSDSAIVTHSFIDTIPAWKFLETPLVTGHEFTHPLGRPFGDNMFLRARYGRIGRFQTRGRHYENALEVLYLVDWGIGTVGDELGYYRFFDYGTVVYVPEIGPVFSYERKYVDATRPFSSGYGDLTVWLVGTASPDRDPYVLSLSGRVRLRGTLRNVDGAETGSEVVDDADDVKLILERNGRQFAADYSEGGMFTFENLDRGRYRVKAWVGLSEADAPASGASHVVTMLDGDATLPGALELSSTGGLAAVPNGFTRDVSIRYTLSAPSTVHLEIQDLARRTVRVLANGTQPAGAHAVIWNSDGAPPGPYWAVLVHDGGSEAELLFKR